MYSEDDTTREEFANWTTNAALLYDFVASHTLQWPTMTVDCLPLDSHFENESPPDGLSSGEVVMPCLTSTFTGGEETNYLSLIDVVLPSAPAGDRQYLSHSDYGGFSFGSAPRKFVIRKYIPLESEANRAIHMPQMPRIVITVGPYGHVNIIDLSIGDASGTKNAVMAKLKGHTDEAWGAEWNPSRRGTVATVADDLQICIWDIAHPIGEANLPRCILKPHTAPPQDVSWKRRNDDILASVGDDGHLCVCDCRCPTPVSNCKASGKQLNSVHYSPHRDYLIATAGHDNEVTLWDDRQLSYSLHRMLSHEKQVVRVVFNPEEEHFVASASQDKRVIIWDMRRIGMEQRPEDAEDGPPELLFSHGGHTSSVNDVCWSQSIGECGPMLLSASDDNQLQIWKMSSDLFKNDDGNLDTIEDLDDFDVEDDEQDLS